MPQTAMADALEGWREGERLLDELPPLDPDHETVALAVSTLRSAYQRLATTEGITDATLANSREVIAASRDAIRAVSERRR